MLPLRRGSHHGFAGRSHGRVNPRPLAPRTPRSNATDAPRGPPSSLLSSLAREGAETAQHPTKDAATPPSSPPTSSQGRFINHFAQQRAQIDRQLAAFERKERIFTCAAQTIDNFVATLTGDDKQVGEDFARLLDLVLAWEKSAPSPPEEGPTATTPTHSAATPPPRPPAVPLTRTPTGPVPQPPPTPAASTYATVAATGLTPASPPKPTPQHAADPRIFLRKGPDTPDYTAADITRELCAIPGITVRDVKPTNKGWSLVPGNELVKNRLLNDIIICSSLGLNQAETRTP